MGNHDTYPYMSTAPTWRGWETAWRADAHLGDEYMSQQFQMTRWHSGGSTGTIRGPCGDHKLPTPVSQPAIHGIAEHERPRSW